MVRILTTLSVWLMLPLEVIAQSQFPAPLQTQLKDQLPNNSADYSGDVIPEGYFIKLIILIVVIVALWIFSKRLPKLIKPTTAGSLIDIVSTRSIGTREKLVIVHALDQELLLAVTTSTINTLARRDLTTDFKQQLQSAIDDDADTSTVTPLNQTVDPT